MERSVLSSTPLLNNRWLVNDNNVLAPRPVVGTCVRCKIRWLRNNHEGVECPNAIQKFSKQKLVRI